MVTFTKEIRNGKLHFLCNAKNANIIWIEPQLCKDIIKLMEGFDQLHVRQKTVFKRHSIKGYQKLVVHAETVAFGSQGAAVEGCYYFIATY